MGYSTELIGRFNLDRKLEDAHYEYLCAFSNTSRMIRNSMKMLEYDDPIRDDADMSVGVEGCFCVNDIKNDGVIDYNRPPFGQPGLWCHWIPTEDREGIEWNGAEKFYDYVEWIEYIIEYFLDSWGYKLNGVVHWKGEDPSDIGTIFITDNKVEVIEGKTLDLLIQLEYNEKKNLKGWTDMEFRKYNSIDNTYRSKAINDIINHGFSDTLIEWCVLLKVHGSNVSVFINENEIRWARKEDFIATDEKFFNIQAVAEKYNDRFRELFNSLGVNSLVLRGELFGGSYPHPEVRKENHASRVQKGVFYCPHNDFYLFDIEVDGVLLSHDEVITYGMELDIPYAEYLFRGTFRECLGHSNQFPDPLHKLWDLPELDDNVCEGIIIKPVKPLYLNSGSRVILKNKNEKFEEKANKSDKNKKAPVELSEQAQELLLTAQDYVTEGRLRNVLSHGNIQVKNHKSFGPLLGEFSSDAYEDFIKDNDKFFFLDKNEQSMVKKGLSNECIILLRAHFLDIIDGEF